MPTPVRVWSALNYLTRIDEPWRQQDWTANRVIKAVKGDLFNGYFDFKIGDRRKRFNSANAAEFLPPLFSAVGAKLSSLVAGEFDLVPIPNSTATIADLDEEDFRTFLHATAITDSIGPRAHPLGALRWIEEKVPAHAGGSRDPHVHFDNLQVVYEPENPVILFDDVMTTGSQMIASYRRLAVIGAVPILGIVVGRATTEQQPSAFGWKFEDVETDDIPFDLENF